MIQKLFRKNWNIETVSILPVWLRHHNLSITLVKAVPLAVSCNAGPCGLLLLLNSLVPSSRAQTSLLSLRLKIMLIAICMLVVRELLVIPELLDPKNSQFMTAIIIPVFIPLSQLVIFVLLRLCTALTVVTESTTQQIRYSGLNTIHVIQHILGLVQQTHQVPLHFLL